MVQKVVRIDEDVWKELFIRKISGNKLTLNDVIKEMLGKK